jgi:hypothetical protein
LGQLDSEAGLYYVTNRSYRPVYDADAPSAAKSKIYLWEVGFF